MSENLVLDRLPEDCRLAAKCLEETGTFEIGQSLFCEAADEITRLRAALADAQAVGFAAGVEAAAKVASGRWAHWMETADRLYEMDDREARQDSDRATCRATEATAIATAIRAIAGDTP